ncbi:hypothetical protein V1264_023269 [Littorina saxatilis]|uniref:Uncharacterized protein n=1 Tax=Littorina saxatilis TaxID=31220 RepID=A0AAN9G9I1_9CAEN
MSTKQAVFVRSYKKGDTAGDGKPEGYRDRAFSFYSAYSFGSKMAATGQQIPLLGTAVPAKKIEDDLETVLDVNEKRTP